MSGTGAAVAPRMQHAELRLPHSPADLTARAAAAAASFCPTNGCEPAVAAEREAAIEHIRRKIETAKSRSGWTIPVEEVGHIVRVLDELACDLERGLHLS